ncbi:hypothetical protein ACFSHQ_15660 [Gemmobacter lanyuensis]
MTTYALSGIQVTFSSGTASAITSSNMNIVVGDGTFTFRATATTPRGPAFLRSA